MALTLSFDGPDADRATAIHHALTSTSPDGVSQEMVDQLLEVAAGCSDRALADSASNAYLLAPVVADAGLSVRLVVPEGEDSWLTIELPEELRAEVERVPAVQLAGLWVQALAALRRLGPYATSEMEQLVMLCTAAATISVLEGEIAVDTGQDDPADRSNRGARAVIAEASDGTGAAGAEASDAAGAAVGGGGQNLLQQIRASWRNHGELDIDRELIDVLFSLATQTLQAAISAHGDEALLLPLGVDEPSVTTGFTTLAEMETTATSRTTAVVPTDPEAPGRLQSIIGGNANLSNALWQDILITAAAHLRGTGEVPRETLDTVLEATADCLAAAEIVGHSG
ncbi:MAG: hypothetical protein L0J74_09215 [Corynebacterium sp.]|uniref:hypothetical protein n=1 Tax=Corynebacterium sp. TaxID=1720 RepID=UPI0026486CDA|nr:hypothetical protein [Corynebacterium sp.]MDN6283419.1 hypothetical protein [Corynebacterium sp.]MDN6305962.1 hypothetical protein [Corynebacterium sp.]MDN6366918.1 hypothetical protein [Corynebacterium sp.]MDN6375684.1 hypothetical protein [Corynebacterium sp.]MDN6397191.1 hypothetical protein [Corynebacterium sp.]